MNISNPIVKAEFDKYEVALKKAVEHFRLELSYIRAGRANPSILNKVVVDYYGTPTPINQLANITVPEARTLLISLWDTGALKATTKAILASDIGITPIDDGKSIRLNFPALTEEKRIDLKKQVKRMSDDQKVVLRNERRDIIEVLKKFKKESTITEDDLVTYEKEVMKILDKAIEQIDKLLKEKEVEIMEI